jgi:hypothetical protein
MQCDGFDVLTIHAESEGGINATMFEQFLDGVLAEGIEVVPMSELLPADIPVGALECDTIQGREGWVAVRGGSTE